MHCRSATAKELIHHRREPTGVAGHKITKCLQIFGVWVRSTKNERIEAVRRKFPEFKTDPASQRISEII
jgi:hypothetical protein